MPRFATRWLAVARIARRDARQHKGRTVLIVAMLMLPALAGTLFATVWQTERPGPGAIMSLQLGTRAQAAIAWEQDCPLTQSAAGSASKCLTGEPGQGTEKGAGAIATAGVNADRLVPALSRDWRLIKGRSSEPFVLAAEVDLSRLPGILVLSEGRAPQRAGEAVLPEPTAARLGATLGDEVTFLGEDDEETRVRVTGIGTDVNGRAFVFPGTLPPPGEGGVTTAGWLGQSETVYYVTGDEPVSWAQVQRLGQLGFVTMSREVVSHPPAGAPSDRDIYPEEPNMDAVAVVAGLAGIGVVEVLLIIGPAFAVGARRSRRTLALLAASGGEAKDLRRVMTASGIGLGLLAGAIGAAAGAALAWLLLSLFQDSSARHYPLHIPWWAPSLAVPVTAVLGALAAWIPGRSVARLDPVLALRGGPDAVSGRRTVPWPGLVASALGLGAALTGAATGNAALAMAGAVALFTGVILLSGSIVSLAVRLAPRAGLATRIALRDAGRHRSRTAPALAAVIACVAGGTLAIGYEAGDAAVTLAQSQPVIGEGLISVAADLRGAGTPDETAMAQVLPQIEAIAPGATAFRVALAAPGDDAPTVSAVCPGSAASGTDYSCRPASAMMGGESLWSAGEYGTSDGLVDDGALTAASGLPGAAEAAAAIRSGKVLVNEPWLLDANGNATLAVGPPATEDNQDPLLKRISVPAAVTGWSPFPWSLVLPPAVAQRIGAKAVFAGYLVVPASPLTDGQIGLIRGLSESAGKQQVTVLVEQEPDTGLSPVLVIAIAALIVAAAAVWIAVGLAAADSRSDQVTLAAVGAAPRTRRRLAGAQAAVIAVTGSLVGVPLGLMLLWVVVTITNRTAGIVEADVTGQAWPFLVPWQPQLLLAAGAPLIAVLAAMACTRSKLPVLTRRGN